VLGETVGKKKSAKRLQKGMASDDPITEEKLFGFFAAAYVLDVAGMLDPAKKSRLDSLQVPGCPAWDQAVEQMYGISRTFVRSVYALCSELKSPEDSILFIIRGLGCPDYQSRLAEVLGEASRDS
jgi:hypothetical protein